MAKNGRSRWVWWAMIIWVIVILLAVFGPAIREYLAGR